MTTHAPVRRTADIPAFKMFRTQVERVRRLSPHLVRITFAGPELFGMTSGGLDQRIKLLLPQPGQLEPVMPHELSVAALRAIPEDVRPSMRTYTVREYRPADAELDIDFVLHGDTGPGSRFAGCARPGDRVGIFGPNLEYAHGPRLGGVEYKLDQLRRHTLVIGDETALPAIGGIMEALPPEAHATVFVELPDVSDAQRFRSVAKVDAQWIARAPSGVAGEAMLSTIASSVLPSTDCYSWIAGEASMVTSLRRHLVRERGFDRSSVTFMGYWRTDGPIDD